MITLGDTNMAAKMWRIFRKSAIFLDAIIFIHHIILSAIFLSPKVELDALNKHPNQHVRAPLTFNIW